MSFVNGPLIRSCGKIFLPYVRASVCSWLLMFFYRQMPSIAFFSLWVWCWSSGLALINYIAAFSRRPTLDCPIVKIGANKPS